MLFFSPSNDLSSVGEPVDLMPTQQKQDLHTQMKEWKKGFSKQTLIGGFTFKYGAFALLWGSSAQFNYIKRQLNWILQADKA